MFDLLISLVSFYFIGCFEWKNGSSFVKTVCSVCACDSLWILGETDSLVVSNGINTHFVGSCTQSNALFDWFLCIIFLFFLLRTRCSKQSIVIHSIHPPQSKKIRQTTMQFIQSIQTWKIHQRQTAKPPLTLTGSRDSTH